MSDQGALLLRRQLKGARVRVRASGASRAGLPRLFATPPSLPLCHLTCQSWLAARSTASPLAWWMTRTVRSASFWALRALDRCAHPVLSLALACGPPTRACPPLSVY